MQDTTLKMTLKLEKLSIRDTGFLISVNTGEWQKHNNFSRGGFREGTGGDASPFFGITCFFCSHFEESQTVLFEVELIINNAPLRYVYLNTIETCLTPIICYFGDNIIFF